MIRVTEKVFTNTGEHIATNERYINPFEVESVGTGSGGDTRVAMRSEEVIVVVEKVESVVSDIRYWLRGGKR
jgi:uncharacterized protein YlzI (FlbEa/FlbD family)